MTGEIKPYLWRYRDRVIGMDMLFIEPPSESDFEDEDLDITIVWWDDD